MGVDYERLAYWDDFLESIDPLTLLFEKRLRAPPRLVDRERLKSSLIKLDLDLPGCLVVDDIIESVADHIYSIWMLTRRSARAATSPMGPSEELRMLQGALSAWVDKHLDDREGYHLHGNNPEKKSALTALSSEVSQLLHLMEDEIRENIPKGKQESLDTTFLRGLYQLYIDLTGKRGLSNDGYGPGVRFITECAALVGITAPRGLRQLIMASVQRANLGSLK